MTNKEKLDDLIAIQCSDGNWNYDSYMHGMANGMILARSVIYGGEPEFLEAPDEWLHDKPTPVTVEAISTQG